MAEAAAAEMHADPDEPGLVHHQVDVVVARADRAELRRGLLPVVAHVGRRPRLVVVEQRVLGPLGVAAADPERDHPAHVGQDGGHTMGDGGERRVQPHGHVAAADVEADAGDADLALVGDHAADRLRVAEVTVGADHAGHHVADAHAVAHLAQRRCVVGAEYHQRRVLRRRRPAAAARRRGRCARRLAASRKPHQAGIPRLPSSPGRATRLSGSTPAATASSRARASNALGRRMAASFLFYVRLRQRLSRRCRRYSRAADEVRDGGGRRGVEADHVQHAGIVRGRRC